ADLRSATWTTSTLRRRPIQPTYGEGSTWSTWLTEDQRFVASRDDVLSWQSDVLDRDPTIAGQIEANLFASTGGSDADWVPKSVDVYPDNDAAMPGHQLM